MEIIMAKIRNFIPGISIFDEWFTIYKSWFLETHTHGDSFGNFNAARELEIIHRAPQFILLYLLDLGLPFGQLPGLHGTPLFKAHLAGLNSVKLWIEKLFIALSAEVISLVLKDSPLMHLILAASPLTFDTGWAPRSSVWPKHPICWVDKLVTGRAALIGRRSPLLWHPQLF